MLFSTALSLLLAAGGVGEVPSWASPAAMPEAPVVESMPPPPPPPPPPVPLDGGLGLLALAGGAYAARRLRR